jgi:quinol monooxygenase YgiN
MSVSRIGEFHAATNQVDALRDFLKSILPIIRSSQGCVSCQLLQDQEDAAKFVMTEVWDSVEAHQASTKNIPQELLVKIRPLLASAPQGKYWVEK